MRPIRVEPTTVECTVTPLPARAWWAVAGLLALLGGLCGLFATDAVWFDPLRLAPISDYAVDQDDATVFSLARARAPERRHADYLLLGSSAAREAFQDEAALTRAGAGAYAKLTGSAQTPLESLYLLEQQPLRRGQVVLLAIGVSQLDSDDRGQRIANGLYLQSPAAFAAAHPWLLPQPESWLRRRIDMLRGARRLLGRYLQFALPHRLQRAIYGVQPPQSLEFAYDHMTPAQVLAVAQSRQALRAKLDRNGAENLARLEAALAAAARSCQRQGATLVLLENPHLDSDPDTTFGPWWERYTATVRRVAQQHGLRYENFAGRVALAPSHFVDAVHLGPAGRAAWTAQLLHEAPSWRTPER